MGPTLIESVRTYRTRASCKWLVLPAALLLLLLAALLHNSFKPYTDLIHHKSDKSYFVSDKTESDSIRTESEHVKIIGLVPAGRRDRLSILDCYLRRNLAANGGILDEVHFVINTDNEDDLKWMKDNLSGQQDYFLPDLDSTQTFDHDWSPIYKNIERNTYYLKIDDDVVFMADGSIEAMLKTKLENPDLAIVSANVVNHPLLSWVHYHHGVSRPYLPELDRPAVTPSAGTWRASKLPRWRGSKGFTIDAETKIDPPFENHRWLPVKRKNNNLERTPAAMSEYNPFGRSWKRWEVAAQEHYSLLEHLEDDPSLEIYDFGLWHSVYERLSINCILFLGDDILDHGPVGKDDEYWLTKEFTKKMKRHIGVVGKAVVAHFTYGTQQQLESTDLLSRYQAYADEKICRHD